MSRSMLSCPSPGVLPVPEGHGTVGTGCSLLCPSPTAPKEGRSLSSLGACAERVASGNTGEGKEREGLREGSEEAYAKAGYAGLSMGAAVPHYCHRRAAAALCIDHRRVG